MQKIGKYEVVREIGHGGMGKVYEARDSVLGRTVAIKLMLEAQHLDEEMRARFHREAQAAGNLKHPNVVTIHDLSVENGTPYIVMEYLEGKDLKELLETPESLSSTERLSIAAQVAKGLAYAHQNGVVHRDIKPGNVRVLEDGQAKIMDFGIAHVPNSDITKAGIAVGTWDYMSPEQVTGGKIDHRTDIWSLGVILYEMLAGRAPFECESVATLVYKITHQEPPSFESLGVDIPHPLAAVVLKALARSPGDRYQDAGELSTDLERHVSALSTEIDHLHAEIERDVQKYIQLATALCLKKRFDEAATAARQAMILDPESADVKRVLEHVRQELARARHEKQALRMAKQARDLTKRGRRNEALDRIAGALALAPMDSEVRKIHEEIVGRVQGADQGKESAAPVAADSTITSSGAQQEQAVQTTPTEARESSAEPAVAQSSERPGAAREPEPVGQKPADEEAAAQQPAPPTRSPVPVSRAVVTAGGQSVVARASTPRPKVTSIRGSQRSPARRSPRWLYLPIAISLILAAVVGLGLNRAAPAVVAPGFASMNITPWAEIRALKNVTSGEFLEPEEKVTPCFLALPAGEYEVQFVNPHFPEPLTLALVVRSGETVSLQGAIPGFDHAEFFPDF